MEKGNQEKVLKTSQSTRKKTPNMSKNELATELEEHRAKEAKYHSSISELKKELSELKGALSGLRQFLAAESPLKMMENIFYFTSKAFSVLKIFKFLSRLFGHAPKRLD